MKEITSAQHPLVKHWVHLRQNSQYRKDEKRILLEGKNAVQDIAKSHSLQRLIIKDKANILDAEEIFLVTDAIMQKISGTEHPEGVIAELEMPQNRPLTSVKRVLVFDRIQDPGNLGTLIRSAVAFGWDGAFLLQGSCDPYNDKALRAAKGATFLLPIQMGSWDDLKKVITENGLQLVVAALEGAKPSPCRSIALVLGNEAQGALVPESFSPQKVSLAMQGPMESLNVAVAGSILLYLYQEGK